MVSVDEVIGYITSKNFENIIPEGMSVSIPLFEIGDGKAVDSVFVYGEDTHKCICSRPSVKIDFDAVDRRVVNCYDYYEFSDKLKDLPQVTDIHYSIVSDTEKYTAACELYQNVYGRIREFAFRDEITSDEKTMLVSFVRSLFAMVPPELKIVYGTVFINFFNWVNKL